MNCKLRKIRAKVVFFRELRGICVKKSGDFWTNTFITSINRIKKDLPSARCSCGKRGKFVAAKIEQFFQIAATF